MPDWRDPLPRAPGPVTSRWSCLGLTRCRRLGRWGGTAWLRMADAAPIPPAPQAVGAGRVLLEDLLAVISTERFPTLGLVFSPGNPKDRRPAIGSLALPGHSCHLLRPNRGGKTPIPSPGGTPAVWLLQPGISPSTAADATGFGNASVCAEGQPDAVAHVGDARTRQSMRSARWVPGGKQGVGQRGNGTAKMVSSSRIVRAASVWCTTRMPISRAGSRYRAMSSTYTHSSDLRSSP